MSIMKLRNKKLKLGDKGFTLVELIVVIAILAVLTAILAPQFTRYIEKSRMASDDTFAGELRGIVEISVAEAQYAIETTPKVVWDPKAGTITVEGDFDEKGKAKTTDGILTTAIEAMFGLASLTAQDKLKGKSTTYIERDYKINVTNSGGVYTLTEGWSS